MRGVIGATLAVAWEVAGSRCRTRAECYEKQVAVYIFGLDLSENSVGGAKDTICVV